MALASMLLPETGDFVGGMSNILGVGEPAKATPLGNESMKAILGLFGNNDMYKLKMMEMMKGTPAAAVNPGIGAGGVKQMELVQPTMQAPVAGIAQMLGR